MRRVIMILLWSSFVLHQAIVCRAQNNGEEMTHPVIDLNASPFRVTWPGVSADELTVPVGLIDRLPPDGTWARFERDGTFFTIASVGKVTVAQQPCRWIEVILEEGGRDLVWKLLIREDYPQRGQNMLEQAMSVWHCKGQEKPLNVTGMDPPDEFGPLTSILAGPDQEVRPLAPQVVETKQGRFECAGWTGRRLMELNEREIDASYRQWAHDKSPFGVLRSEVELAIRFEGRVVRSKESIVLAEAGTGARSRIPTANLSMEELTARPFAPAAGWQWAMPPENCDWASMATRGLAMAVERSDQEFRLTLAYPWTPGGAEYRPVAFDVDQNRYEFETKCGGASGRVALTVFALAQNVLPASQIKRVGIEKLSQEVRKQPRALAGKPLPDLSDMRFNFIPKSVYDKAILMCFFDMNQRPSRNCTRDLAVRAEELKEKGLIVAAVQASNVDENALSEWIKSSQISFPVGIIKGDAERTRFAWGVRSLAWLILTDRDHLVRAEGFGVGELNEKIKELENAER